MSCSTINSQIAPLNVSAGSLPEGFCPGSMQDLLAAFAARLIISLNQNSIPVVGGSIEPTSNVGIWFKDCSELFIFDDSLGRYVPIQFPSIASVRPGMVQAWAGTVSNIPAGYLLADGRLVLQTDYPLLYAAIGQCYAPPGPCPVCEGSFYLPNLCNKFLVGACVDDEGCSKTNVSDGVTLTKCSEYTPHAHPFTACINLDLVPVGGAEGGSDNSFMRGNPGTFCGTGTTGPDSPRALPPYCALPWIIKT